MSQQNVDALRRGFDAWQRGDTQLFELLAREFVAPKFEMQPLYLDKVYRGPDGLRAMFGDVGEFWAEYRFELDDIVDLGDQVVAVGRVHGRGRESGVPIDQPLAVLCSFDGANLVHAKSFRSMADALEAAGVQQ